MKIFASLLLSLLTILLGGGVAYADVNDFVINRFDAQYILNNDKPGGSLKTTEKLEVTFNDNNHGILRAIPKQYKSLDTKLDVVSVSRDGQSEEYSRYTENGNLVLKIGSPDKTVTGKHTYEIVYSQERVVNFDGDMPEFYWDVNGNQWQQKFEAVTAELIVMPTSLKESAPSFCYTGLVGSSARQCSIEKSEPRKYVVSSERPLNANETLTIAVGLEGAGFIEPTLQDRLQDYKKDAAGLLLGVGLLVYAGIIWFRNGRDYDGKKVIVPEYEPPKGLTPAEVGMLADYKVDGRDLTATLIDLAVRGHVRLHEVESKVLFFTNKKYSVELLKPDLNGLKIHEKNLLEGMFRTFTAGEMIEMSKISRTTMYSKIQSARKEVKNSLQDSFGYLESRADKKMTIFLIVGFLMFFAAFFVHSFLGVGGVIGAIIAACGFLAFGSAMQRRSHAGVEMYEKVLGLKMYMKVAEQDRLAKMQSVDRPYAEPTKTLELFEKLLPFAVALGVEKSWSKQFDGILTKSPDWVSTNSLAAFSGASLASSINGVTTSFGRSFEASSGASGSSGGGSAGGGGGGGGGGGW